MADVPYSPVPSVQPTIDALPSQNIPAGPEEFGAGIGRSLQRVGGIARQAQEAQFALSLKFAQEQAETVALDASTEYSRQSNALERQFGQLRGQEAVNALPEYQKKLSELNRTIGSSLKSPMAKRVYAGRAAGFETTSLNTLGIHADQQAQFAAEAADVAAIQAAQSRFASHFGLTPTEPDIREIMLLSKSLAARQGLPPEAADVLMQKNVGDALAQVMNIRILSGHIAEAKAIYEHGLTEKIPGTDIPIFSGPRVVQMGEDLRRAEDAQIIDEQRKIAAADAEQRRQSEAAYKRYVDQIIADPTKLDIKAVARDPYLSGQHGETLLRLWQEQIKKLQGGGEDENKGPGFWDTFRAVTQPNSPIKSPQQIYELTGPGRPLTLTGARALVTLMNERRSGAQGGNFQTQATTRFFTNFHAKIAETYGPSSAEGEQRYFQFYMDKSQQIRDGIAAGKSVDQMLNPKSSDYIANDLDQYLPPVGSDVNIEEEVAPPSKSWFSFSDWMSWLTGGGGDGFSTANLDKNVPSGPEGSEAGLSALRGAMAADQIERKDAAAYARKRGWLAAAPPPPQDQGAMPSGMIEPGSLSPADVGDNWATFEVAEDGIHKTVVLPTRPGDRPADDSTGFLGDAIERWRRNRRDMIGVFEDEASAQAVMRATRRAPAAPLQVPPVMR